MTTLVGQKVGKYHIVARLGHGGMARVYKAYQPGLNRYVAIKMLHSHLTDDPDFIGRFQREAHIVASFRHQNIVQVFDFEAEDDMYYMVMEYVDGPALKSELVERVSTGQLFTLVEAVRLLATLCDTLSYAHAQGMVHRDIKPDNCIFTRGGRILVLDFGIARILGNTKYKYTSPNAIIGTPAYISPEQGKGERIDERSDIYSLGVVLYEMVTGRVPYQADTPFEVIIKHINEPLTLPSLRNPDLPKTLEDVILKALSKDPADRFQSASEFATVIRAALNLPPDDDALKNPVIPISELVSTNELQPTDPIFLKASYSSVEAPEAKPKVGLRIICPDCNAVNNGTTYCIRCGRSLKTACPFCYTQNNVDEVYCKKCGANFQHGKQRRQALQNERRKHEADRREAWFQALLESLKSEIALVRNDAVKALGSLKDHRAIDPLIEALNDPEPVIRYWALEGLVKLRAETAVEAIGNLLQDKHKKVSTRAAQALQEIDTSQAKQVLKAKSKLFKWWPF